MLRALIQFIKGFYDILVSYLLIWIVGLALVAFGIHTGIEALATALEFDTPDRMWSVWALQTGFEAEWLRLGVMVPAWVVTLLILRKPVQWLQPYLERFFDFTVRRFRRWLSGWPATLGFIELSFSVVITVLLVPFVVQPTLVAGWDLSAWGQRAVNLVDGTASDAVVESVVGLYRRFDAEPVVVAGAKLESTSLDEGLAEAESLDRSVEAGEADGPTSGGGPDTPTPDAPSTGPAPAPKPAGKHPMMDRWDPYIDRAVGGDDRMFSYVKAFMYVESAGRQYAVSRTGCAGLMQFCSPTARSGPFREIFGVGEVYVCRCDGPCRIAKPVQRALESAEAETVAAQADDFPCELTDARFDPDKAIRAGATYVKRLGSSYGFNPYIMYVGYNSGPAVAKRLWKAVGQDPDASLATIEKHLPAALKPWYGKGSAGRARSLVRVHLPKIAKAQGGYLAARGLAANAAPASAIAAGGR